MFGVAELLGLPKVIVSVPVEPTPSEAVEKLSEVVTAPAAPMVKLCCTCAAGFQLVSPAWLALIVQVPVPTIDTVLPLIVQTAGVAELKATTSGAFVVALTA